MATQAGIKRTVARGEHIGPPPDGYRLTARVKDGKLQKRMHFDPDRQPLIELIFRPALRGRTCGQITKTINNRGRLTEPACGWGLPNAYDGCRWQSDHGCLSPSC